MSARPDVAERNRARTRPLEDRFWEKVEPEPTSGCWLWTGSVAGNGYGGLTINRRRPDQYRIPAHRFAYELLVGPIPKGLVIDHLCRVRSCVNPAHMEPVTDTENVMRGEGLGAKNARKTHCIRGHEFTPENTYVRTNAQRGRSCKTCRLDRQRLWHAKRREAS